MQDALRGGVGDHPGDQSRGKQSVSAPALDDSRDALMQAHNRP
jgi:hypothetical protein